MDDCLIVIKSWAFSSDLHYVYNVHIPFFYVLVSILEKYNSNNGRLSREEYVISKVSKKVNLNNNTYEHLCFLYFLLCFDIINGFWSSHFQMRFLLKNKKYREHLFKITAGYNTFNQINYCKSDNGIIVFIVFGCRFQRIFLCEASIFTIFVTVTWNRLKLICENWLERHHEPLSYRQRVRYYRRLRRWKSQNYLRPS